LLTRNILVRTEVQGVSDTNLDQQMSERRFAHTMYMGGAKGSIQYAEFKYMGNLATLARYPIHFHKISSAGNGAVVRGNSIWRSGNRGYQPHTSQGILFEDNVAFDTIMSPYYVERTGSINSSTDKARRDDPLDTPNNIWFVHNLGVQAAKAPSKGSADQNDDTIFWFDQLDQIMLGNVGVGAGMKGGTGDIPQGSEREDDLFSGIWFDERTAGTGKIRPPLFLKNEIHSSGSDGLGLWQQADAPAFDLGELLVWRNGQSGVKWGYYRSPFRLFQLTAVENEGPGIWGDRFNQGGSRYVQDAVFRGNKVGIFHDAGTVRPIYPDFPWTYIRATFDNNREAGIALEAKTPSSKCAGRAKDDPVAARNCHANYTLLLEPTFKNGDSIDFSYGKDAVLNGGNKNTLWRVQNAAGLPSSLPSDFFLARPDQQTASNRTDFSSLFLQGSGGRMASELNSEAFLAPIASLPSTLNPPVYGHTGSNSGGDELPRTNYWTWEKAVDMPPEVSISVSLANKIATIKANATDDKGVNRVICVFPPPRDSS